MKTGPLYPQGSVNYDGWEKIYEHEISASDTEAQLLATFQGADAATSGTADTGQTITFAGTAQLDDAQSKIGATSLLLDGNSDYVTVPDSADWTFGTGDFTIDFWINFNDASSSQALVSQYVSSDNYFMLRHSGASLQFYSKISATEYTVSYTWSPTLNTWYHIALVRSGTTTADWKYYIDGVSKTPSFNVAGAASQDLPDYASTLAIGAVNGSTFFDGYLDAVRITKGTALWTANFTPPTTIDDYVGTTAITIFGLEGDTDEQYMLDVNIIDSNTIGGISARLNGDSGTNYGTQYLYGVAASLTAARITNNTSINMGNTAVDGQVSSGRLILNAKSGYVRTGLTEKGRQITGTTVTQLLVDGQVWNNTADEVTSISVFAAADNFAVGSLISLYRRITA